MLKKDAGEIRREAWKNYSLEIPQPCEKVRPLVIRANVGEWNHWLSGQMRETVLRYV
ncbi:hypothetical protein MR857_15480 [bacterium]|nr:hypothetical protein [bacterium]MDY3022681.1 hypothetical protein [Oliverpabstia sp.]